MESPSGAVPRDRAEILPCFDCVNLVPRTLAGQRLDKGERALCILVPEISSFHSSLGAGTSPVLQLLTNASLGHAVAKAVSLISHIP